MSLCFKTVGSRTKQILVSELENQWISRFCYLQMGNFIFRRAVRIKLSRIEHYFFLWPYMDKLKFTDHWQVCNYVGSWAIKPIILVREELKKTGLFHDIDQKGILKKSLLLEALEIVTCHWGGWVSKEDVTTVKL